MFCPCRKVRKSVCLQAVNMNLEDDEIVSQLISDLKSCNPETTVPANIGLLILSELKTMKMAAMNQCERLKYINEEMNCLRDQVGSKTSNSPILNSSINNFESRGSKRSLIKFWANGNEEPKKKSSKQNRALDCEAIFGADAKKLASGELFNRIINLSMIAEQERNSYSSQVLNFDDQKNRSSPAASKSLESMTHYVECEELIAGSQSGERNVHPSDENFVSGELKEKADLHVPDQEKAVFSSSYSKDFNFGTELEADKTANINEAPSTKLSQEFISSISCPKKSIKTTSIIKNSSKTHDERGIFDDSCTIQGVSNNSKKNPIENPHSENECFIDVPDNSEPFGTLTKQPSGKNSSLSVALKKPYRNDDLLPGSSQTNFLNSDLEYSPCAPIKINSASNSTSNLTEKKVVPSQCKAKMSSTSLDYQDALCSFCPKTDTFHTIQEKCVSFSPCCADNPDYSKRNSRFAYSIPNRKKAFKSGVSDKRSSTLKNKTIIQFQTENFPKKFKQENKIQSDETCQIIPPEDFCRASSNNVKPQSYNCLLCERKYKKYQGGIIKHLHQHHRVPFEQIPLSINKFIVLHY